MEDIKKEENKTLDQPQNWGAKSKTNVTTSIPLDVWKLAKENGIAWNDALEFGVLFKRAEIDGFDYPDSKLQEKLLKIVNHRNALILEVEALRQQVEGVESVEIVSEAKDDVDNILNAKAIKE